MRLRTWIGRLRHLLTRRQDADFDLEVQQHLDLLTERYVRDGMTRSEAASAARRQFGNTTLLRERRRDLQTIPLLESLSADCRYAARTIRKSPAFAASVVITLALGIGANTAIFSICNTVLLKPLPYPDAHRLVMVWEEMGKGVLIRVSAANFVDWRRDARTLSSVAAISPLRSFVLTGSGEPVRLAAAAVSWDFFSVLGTPMAMGRSFLQEEDEPGRNRVAVLAYSTWVERFAARSDIVGTSVTLSDTSYTVVGVLPRDFEFVVKAADFQGRTQFDLWVPLAFGAKPSRGSHSLCVFARLAPDADLDRVQAELDVLGANLARAYPGENRGKGIRAVPLREQVTGDLRRALLTLLGAVGFVLAIACANVANLLLTRGAARQHETSLRLAIGASRVRLAQQFLVESTILSTLGGVFGLLLAVTALRAAVSYLPPDLSRAATVTIDWRVLVFTAIVSMLTAVMFGLAPLLQVRRIDAAASLTPGSRVIGSPQGRVRNGLVVVQIAVTLTLLIGAGLMAKSLWTLLRVPLGFHSQQILTARVTLSSVRYKDSAVVGVFVRNLLDRLRNSPGVKSAAAAAYLPLSGDDNGWAFVVEGRPPRGVGIFDVAFYRPVTDGYFEAMDMPIVRGRSLNASDDETSPLVVVINEAMARAYWGTEDPLGQRLQFGGTPLRTIVGIVGDVRHDGLDREMKPEMYLPLGQARNPETAPTILIRSAIDASAMTSTLRAAVSALDPSVPLDRVRTMDQWVTASAGQPRFRTLLLIALSMLALVMAAVGVYGVTNYTVVQRTRELGVYLAVGATPGDVMALVFGKAARLIVAGLAAGLVAAFALTRVIAGLLFNVTPLDLPTFVGVSLLLFVVACLASYVPARRATKIDPLVALRYE
jgi:putative ABC transport system permease protein